MPTIDEADSLQRFIFEHANIRGEIAHLSTSYQLILNQQQYPPFIKKLLGEALISCLLLAGSIKFEGELNLQFQGDKRFPLLIVQCDHDLNLRGFAKFKTGLEKTDYEKAFLHGKMVVVINQYQKTQTYQSLVRILSSSMSDNLMGYFVQSEQIATQVWLAIGEQSAAGMLLQLMPQKEDTRQREQFWEYAVVLGETISEQELLTLDNVTLLNRLYHETELRLFNHQNARFQCRCNKEKMQQVIALLGQQDAEKLLEEQGKIEISCDFCNRHYVFDSIDIALLFRTHEDRNISK